MTKQLDVAVSRTISAPPEKVFDAWLDPEVPGTTWHDCEQLILQPKVDGLFYHTVEHRDRLWAHYGRFIRLERGRKIQHTWMSEATHGLESIVTITLRPAGDGTEFVLRHTGLPDDEMGRTHETGWNYITSQLAEHFEKRHAIS
ncbi:MAG: SRPBCC domain-containing protein [Candidatus Velthaea sp.]|jgi:uncharacterized protein YndB with AHSA1/START domain